MGVVIQALIELIQACVEVVRGYAKWISNRPYRVACGHQWKTFDTMKTFDNDYYGRPNPLPVRVRKTLVCQKCGDIKQVDL